MDIKYYFHLSIILFKLNKVSSEFEVKIANGKQKKEERKFKNNLSFRQTNTFTFDNQGTNNSHLSSNHIDTVEEVHINFVKMIQNTKYLLKIQENIKNTIYNDKYQNSSLIYVNEEIIN